MNPKVAEARERIKANREEVQKRLSNPDLTQEMLGEVEALNAKIAEDSDFVTKFEDARRALGESEASRAADNVDPNRGAELFKHVFPGGINLAGFTADGKVGGSANDLEYAGNADFSESAFKATREPQYKRSFVVYLRKGEKGLSSTDIKTLQEGADGSGGFLVPEDFMQRLLMKKPTPTRVQANVTRMTTGRDRAVIPKVNYTTDDLYTTGIRATFTGEVPASATTARVTDPAFGQVGINIWTAMLSMPLTNNLVEDTSFGLQQWAEDRFSETIDLLKENMILNGTGVGQPEGILMNPGGTGQPAIIAMGNPLGADGVEKMAWAIPEQYDENLKWVMAKTTTGQALALVKDAQGRYMWQSYMEGSIRDSAGGGQGNIKDRTLVGYPVLFQGFMPGLGANNFPIIFGDLAGYTLVDRIGFSIQVLRELYAETNQILLLGRVRFGGITTEEWRLRVGQQA